jgi:hypothetical protein
LVRSPAPAVVRCCAQGGQDNHGSGGNTQSRSANRSLAHRTDQQAKILSVIPDPSKADHGAQHRPSLMHPGCCAAVRGPLRSF